MFFILVQGTDAESKEIMKAIDTIRNEYAINITIERSNENLGCSAGFCKIINRIHSLHYTYALYLEDDWESGQSIEPYIQEIMKAFEYNQDLAAIKLKTIEQWNNPVHPVLNTKNIYYTFTKNIQIGTSHFTFNPTIFRIKQLHAIIPFKTEYEAMQKYHAKQYETGKMKQKFFKHIGKKRVAGWKK